MRLKFKIREKKVSRSLGGDLAIFTFLGLFAAFMALPLIYIISSAFKPLNEIFLFPPQFFVRNPTLDNFKDLFILMAESWVPFSRYAFNSLLITVLGTGGHVIIASMGAFVISKHEFPGKKLFLSMVVLSLMFPKQVTAIPNYIIMSKLGWVNTYLAMIVPAWGMSLGFYLMNRFMIQVHESVIESAKLDGASEFRIFWQIVMPIVKPAWLTLMILSFQQLWRQNGSRFIYREVLKPLPYALQQIRAGGIGRQGVYFVVLFLLMLIPIILFVINQSSVVKTMGTSGID